MNRCMIFLLRCYPSKLFVVLPPKRKLSIVFTLGACQLPEYINLHSVPTSSNRIFRIIAHLSYDVTSSQTTSRWYRHIKSHRNPFINDRDIAYQSYFWFYRPLGNSRLFQLAAPLLSECINPHSVPTSNTRISGIIAHPPYDVTSGQMTSRWSRDIKPHRNRLINARDIAYCNYFWQYRPLGNFRLFPTWAPLLSECINPHSVPTSNNRISGIIAHQPYDVTSGQMTSHWCRDIKPRRNPFINGRDTNL